MSLTNKVWMTVLWLTHRQYLSVADSAGGWADDRLERHRLPCRGGGSQQPETVSTRGVAGPDAGGDGARDADARLPCEEGDASGLGVFSGTVGLHHGGLQCVGPVVRFTTQRIRLRAPLDG